MARGREVHCGVPFVDPEKLGHSWPAFGCGLAATAFDGVTPGHAWVGAGPLVEEDATVENFLGGVHQQVSACDVDDLLWVTLSCHGVVCIDCADSEVNFVLFNRTLRASDLLREVLSCRARTFVTILACGGAFTEGEFDGIAAAFDQNGLGKPQFKRTEGLEKWIVANPYEVLTITLKREAEVAMSEGKKPRLMCLVSSTGTQVASAGAAPTELPEFASAFIEELPKSASYLSLESAIAQRINSTPSLVVPSGSLSFASERPLAI